jgi:hypothetical protein
MARRVGDLTPKVSGLASLGVNQTGQHGFDSAAVPFAHVHLNSGVLHSGRDGQSGILRFDTNTNISLFEADTTQLTTAFQVSRDGGAIFSKVPTSSDIRMLKPRPVARFYGFKDGTSHGNLSWAPSTQAFDIEWTAILPSLNFNSLPTTHESIFGGTTSNLIVRNNVTSDSGGDLLAATVIIGGVSVTSDGGYFIHDNLPHTYRVQWDGSTTTLYRDNIAFESISHSATIPTSAFTIFIGSRTTPSTQEINGILYNILLKDPADDDNTAFFNSRS